MVSVLEGQLNWQLNSVLLDYTPWRKTVFLIQSDSYYHCSQKVLNDKSKLLVMTTVMIRTRSCLEFQHVYAVLLPIDQRIIACQGLYAIIDSRCILAYFFLFESFCCFFHFSLFTWTLQTDWCFLLWRNVFFYRWWPFHRYLSPHVVVTSNVVTSFLLIFGS